MLLAKRKNVWAPHGVLYYDLPGQSMRLGPLSKRASRGSAGCTGFIDCGLRVPCRIDNADFSHPPKFRVALVHELGHGQVAHRLQMPVDCGSNIADSYAWVCRWAPPDGSAIISSITPKASRCGAVTFSASAAQAERSGVRSPNRIAAQPSGVMTE